MIARWIAAAVALIAYLVAVRFDWIPWLRGPAPYPPEWQWPHTDRPFSRAALAALAIGALLVGLQWLVGRLRSDPTPRRAAVGVLALATLLGWAFHLALLMPAPGGATRHLILRAREPTTVSYFNVAISPDAEDPIRFLDRYAARLPYYRDHFLHVASHPPGPVLGFRALLGLFAGRPEWSRWIVDRIGLTPHERAALRTSWTDPQIATAVVGICLMSLLCVLALWPIARLARQLGCSRQTALRIAALWPLVPGAAMFVGSIDAVLALPIALTIAWLVRSGAGGSSTPSAAAHALFAGVAAGLAMQLSYGALFFVGVGVVMARLIRAGRGGTRRAVPALTVTGIALVAGAAVFFLPTLWGHDSIEAMRTTFAMHDEHGSQRSHGLWIAFNAVDYFNFLGLPLVLVAAIGIRDSLRVHRHRPALVCLGWIASCLTAVSVTGVIRGEAGRILIPAMPLTLIAILAIRPTLPGRTGMWLAAALLATTFTLRMSWF